MYASLLVLCAVLMLEEVPSGHVLSQSRQAGTNLHENDGGLRAQVVTYLGHKPVLVMNLGDLNIIVIGGTGCVGVATVPCEGEEEASV